VHVGHLRDLQEAAERGHFDGDTLALQGIADEADLSVLAEQDADVSPGGAVVVQAADFGCDPSGLIDGGPEPASPHRPGGCLVEGEEVSEVALVRLSGCSVCGREVEGEVGEVLE